ncbi:MAG: hypothetical protein A3D24_04960 [Candidatus Blackburnbacteria bacterium RIFCSPHIGHO2_02_FULL_39_13]|uniref:Rod shape-determining protein MreD n=1 Tax=Candidatus Blackburnbacteria bacterium RIFCSPLOWO2_01_FULL_40_20 TaxID=1797519 RepID=A0A1G1VB99_9BACT|nr:MAG: hypothetical protein UT38_C0022G0011 [Microgenomates group bacterium GW2011_GWA2_39_19]OGY07134.1 MAG: hypothetical protein A2694_03630 [Candidatus Blackburnbacteria bacterium RIFCSPHIGHO2_01_FULL_40_17]OGY08956.1 MAG: hypothetical protein A3D24_04960 [Candidatus Blackburnbacteria bacterium RIFCSPHIGHO2_02_FULL_39_13]OGY12698.1 MAG: hypothetical protein A3A77_00185 [Candidatus Blackburnbacteria bacterium RIFCSPLOWO2_01_FULL_40_20]OGY15194.1 MAG: hypothetical protein A3I52_02075 [Candida
MRSRLFVILSLVFALLQGPILPSIFFEEILVVIFSLSNSVSKSALPLFLAGLFLDLLQNQKLGVTSIIFLSTAVFIHYSKSQVRYQTTGGLVYLLFSVFALEMLRSKLVFASNLELPILGSLVFSFLVFYFAWQPQTEGGIRIK